MSVYFDFDFDRECELEESKFFGEIALPSEWLENDVFGEDELFVCQINLSELKDGFCKGLPNRGTLFFFIDMNKRPYKAIIRYYQGEMNECVCFNEDFDTEVDVVEEIPIVQSNEETFVSSFFELEGQYCLLLVEYFKEEPILPIKGDVYFLIDKEDLKSLNFNNIKLKIVS